MITLKPFQVEFIDAIEKSLLVNDKVMAQSPTGSGKTVMFNYIASKYSDNSKKVLIIADRKELIMQTQTRLYHDFGKRCGIIMSSVEPMPWQPIQVASIQTLTRRNFPKADLVIIDEARSSISKSYMKVIEHYSSAKIIGFDATPIRTSGHGFDHIYQDIIIGKSIKYLEKEGMLVPAKCFINPIDRSQLAKIKVRSTGDYDENDLEAFMDKNQINADLVESYLKYSNGKKVIIFAINIIHSKKIEQHYKDAGIACAHIDGSMSGDQRDSIIRSFRSGKIMALVNVGIATYGFDEKTIEVVQFARPTKSLSLFLQMAGRGARCAQNKEHYILLDNANCIIEHGRPNDERKWSLKGKKRGKAKDIQRKIFRVKLPSGEIKEMEESKIPIGIKGLDMVEIKANYRADKFEKLLNFAEYKKFKKSYAMFKFFEQNKDVSEMELKYISNRLQFKYDFVLQMLKNVVSNQK